MPSTDLVPKKRKDQLLLEKIIKNIDPPSPMKPGEKAVTMVMPKRRVLLPKRAVVSQDSVTADKKSNLGEDTKRSALNIQEPKEEPPRSPMKKPKKEPKSSSKISKKEKSKTVKKGDEFDTYLNRVEESIEVMQKEMKMTL